MRSRWCLLARAHGFLRERLRDGLLDVVDEAADALAGLVARAVAVVVLLLCARVTVLHIVVLVDVVLNPNNAAFKITHICTLY